MPHLRIGQSLDLVSSQKALGVTFNNQLRWNDKVEVMMKKACQRLYILRVLGGSGVPPSHLLVVYRPLVRSIFEYACPV